MAYEKGGCAKWQQSYHSSATVWFYFFKLHWPWSRVFVLLSAFQHNIFLSLRFAHRFIHFEHAVLLSRDVAGQKERRENQPPTWTEVNSNVFLLSERPLKSLRLMCPTVYSLNFNFSRDFREWAPRKLITATTMFDNSFLTQNDNQNHKI